MLLFLIQLLCIPLSVCISNSSEVTSTPAAEIPIFSDGYDVNKFPDHSKQTITVNYRVQTLHPAAEVLEFYDTYFNGRGRISSFETCQRNWADLADTTKKSEPAVRLLFASWEHAESNLKVLLWLRHEADSNERNDVVVVEYQVQPIVEKR